MAIAFLDLYNFDFYTSLFLIRQVDQKTYFIVYLSVNFSYIKLSVKFFEERATKIVRKFKFRGNGVIFRGNRVKIRLIGLICGAILLKNGAIRLTLFTELPLTRLTDRSIWLSQNLEANWVIEFRIFSS